MRLINYIYFQWLCIGVLIWSVPYFCEFCLFVASIDSCFLIFSLQLVELFRKGLGGVASWEEVCHWGLGMSFQKPMLFPLKLFLPSTYGSRCKFSAAAPAPCLPNAPWWSWTLPPLKPSTQLNDFFHKLPWLWCFITVINKIVTTTGGGTWDYSISMTGLTVLWFVCLWNVVVFRTLD